MSQQAPQLAGFTVIEMHLASLSLIIQSLSLSLFYHHELLLQMLLSILASSASVHTLKTRIHYKHTLTFAANSRHTDKDVVHILISYLFMFIKKKNMLKRLVQSSLVSWLLKSRDN